MSVTRPKQYEVIKRTRRRIDGVTVGGRHYKFGRQGAFVVHDPGVGRELQKHHKSDVVVCEVDKPRMDVSRNFFGGLPEMPWKQVGRNAPKEKRTRPARDTAPGPRSG